MLILSPSLNAAVKLYDLFVFESQYCLFYWRYLALFYELQV